MCRSNCQERESGDQDGLLRSMFRNLKITDWVAVIALIMSIWFGILSPFLASVTGPKIDIEYPVKVQFHCVNRRAVCEPASPVMLTADLFSFWNNSRFSTRPDVLHKVSGRMGFSDPEFSSEFSFVWRYFTEMTVTEMTDVAKSTRKNAGRFSLNRGVLENVEIQFDVRELSWGELVQLIREHGMLHLSFEVEMEYRGGEATCKLELGDDLKEQLGHVYVASSNLECVA